MSTFVLTDASVVVNSVNLSGNVQSVTIEMSREKGDNTAMGHTARSSSASLKAESISVKFLQDFAAADVDATLNGLYSAGTIHTVVVKATSAAVSATNPAYTLTGFIDSYPVIGGSVGDDATVDVSWANTGSTGIVRTTA